MGNGMGNEMETTYKREMKHNYLIIKPDAGIADTYEAAMLADNCIEGLLRFHKKLVDNRPFFCYEITSRQPLGRLLEQRAMGAGELRHLIMEIGNTLARMEAYLLGEGQILLQPDYIYVNPENFSPWLCLVPGRRGSFSEEMTKLLQYLLGKVDHQDKECVVMAYGVYQESLKENYGMEDLLKLLKKPSEAKEEREDGDQDIQGRPSSFWDGGPVPAPQPIEKARAPGHGKQAGHEREAGRGKQAGHEREACHGKQAGHEREACHGRQAGHGRETCHGKPTGLAKRVAFMAAVWLGLPILAWALWGRRGLEEYWWCFAACDLAAAFMAFLPLAERWWQHGQIQPKQASDFQKTVMDQEEAFRSTPYAPIKDKKVAVSRQKPETIDWQMVFADDQDDGEERAKPGAALEDGGQDTVLLADFGKPSGIRRLASRDKGLEDIEMPYFPFIIGKQEGLADYVLAKDTVSRLHVRIDQEGDAYQVTDLNSTNGTYVCGKLLEMNETAAILPGDEICIANFGFIFT